MDIEQLTLGQIREIAAMVPTAARRDDSHWQIGKCYLIRTVTMALTGRLVKVTDMDFVLEDAAWIADTGRFSDALANAQFSEVEPFPSGQVVVGRGALIDAAVIGHAPRTQK